MKKVTSLYLIAFTILFTQLPGVSFADLCVVPGICTTNNSVLPRVACTLECIDGAGTRCARVCAESCEQICPGAVIPGWLPRLLPGVQLIPVPDIEVPIGVERDNEIQSLDHRYQ